MKKKVKVYRLYSRNFRNETLVTGTIKDVRIFMKNRWSLYIDEIRNVFDIDIEEDYYTYLDDNINLRSVINQFMYDMDEICEVSIDDFMD